VFDDYFSTPYSKKSVVCTARPLELRLLTGQKEFDFLKWHTSPSWRLHWLWRVISRLSRQYGSIRLSPGVKPPEREGDLDIRGSVHRTWLSRNTNKMQLCNRIYYSKVYWTLNMFRTAHRSSSGALNCNCSLWFIWVGNFPLSLDNGRSPHGYINQRLQIQFRAPNDELCAARNMFSHQ